MDVFTELLPASYQIKSEQSLKDKPKENPQSKNFTKVASNKKNKSTREFKIKSAIVIERRTGDDRRQKPNCRGRWFESREQHDRRESSIALRV